MRRTAVREELEATNFVNDAVLSRSSRLEAEVIGDDKRARGRLKLRLGFDDAHRTASLREPGRGEEAGSRSADNDNWRVFPAGPAIVVVRGHVSASQEIRGDEHAFPVAAREETFAALLGLKSHLEG